MSKKEAVMKGIKASIYSTAIAIALFAAAGQAHAADPEGKFAIKGAGAMPCSAYVEARSRRLIDRLVTFEGWLHGYLTAYNRLEPQTFDIVAWQGNGLLTAALEAYCKQHTDQRFEIAVSGLINTLRPDRLTAQSEMVRISSGDTTLNIYHAVVVRIQEALAKRKLYSGKADGRYSDDMRRSVEAFQKGEKLPVTGLPDSRTLLALLPPSTPPASDAPSPSGSKKPPAKSQSAPSR